MQPHTLAEIDYRADRPRLEAFRLWFGMTDESLRPLSQHGEVVDNVSRHSGVYPTEFAAYQAVLTYTGPATIIRYRDPLDGTESWSLVGAMQAPPKGWRVVARRLEG